MIMLVRLYLLYSVSRIYSCTSSCKLIVGPSSWCAVSEYSIYQSECRELHVHYVVCSKLCINI